MKKIVHPSHLPHRDKVEHLKARAEATGEAVQDYAIGFTAVATIGGRGDDWSAYWLEADDMGQRTATNGDKIPKDLAEAMFPWFPAAGMEYRN